MGPKGLRYVYTLCEKSRKTQRRVASRRLAHTMTRQRCRRRDVSSSSAASVDSEQLLDFGFEPPAGSFQASVELDV
ncbi:hypothetical protein ACLKA6_010580 [Drosophila palustris]